MLDAKHPLYQARLITVKCDDCGTVCEHEKRLLARGKIPLCKPCSYAARGRKARARPKSIVICKCAVCEREFPQTPSQARKARLAKTCSVICRDKARAMGLIYRAVQTPRGQDNPLWEGGRAHINYGADWKSQRDAARLRDSDTCRECGMTKAEHGRALDVHHVVRFIDFADSTEANALTNLITLCRSCHRHADAALYYKRKESGQRIVWSATRRQRRCKRYTTFGDLVSVFARNWRVNNSISKLDDEPVHGIMEALARRNQRPSKARGLDKVTDVCQATTMLRINAEIEADCWQYKLNGEDAFDSRLFAILLKTGDYKHIVDAQRVAYLDWEKAEPSDVRWTDTRVSSQGARGIGPRLLPAWRRPWPQINTDRDNCVLPGGTHIRA